MATFVERVPTSALFCYDNRGDNMKNNYVIDEEKEFENKASKHSHTWQK